GFGVGSAGDPAILRLEGVYGTCGEDPVLPGWELSGGLAGPAGAPVTFDGFAITRVEAEGCVDADGLRLAVSADAAIGDGPDAVPVELSLTLDHGTWSIAGDAGPFDVAVGPISVADATLSFEAEGGADTLGLTIGFSAAEATLFDATVTAITGTLTGSGRLDLHAEMLAAEFAGGALKIEVPGFDLHVPAVDGVLFTAASVVHGTAPHLGDGLEVEVHDLQIHEDGRFSATSVIVVSEGGFGRAIGLGGRSEEHTSELQSRENLV